MKAARALNLLALLALASLSTIALTPAERSAIRTALESAKAAELPDVAELLMRESKSVDRAETAKVIFEYIVAKRAAAARPVFASLAKLFPETFITVSHNEFRTIAAHELVARGLQVIPVRQPRPGNLPSPPTPPLPTQDGNTSSYGGSASSSSGVVRGGTFIPRGAAGMPATGIVVQSKTPINTFSGGNGNGSFAGAQAIPANSGPSFDYSQPRH